MEYCFMYFKNYLVIFKLIYLWKVLKGLLAFFMKTYSENELFYLVVILFNILFIGNFPTPLI